MAIDDVMLRKSLDTYIQLRVKRPGLFRGLFTGQIVTDEETIKDYARKNNVLIGVVYENETICLVVDLLREFAKDGTVLYHTEERIIQKDDVERFVVVPKYNGKYAMINRYKHTIQDYSLEFPSGIIDPKMTLMENLEEELQGQLRISSVSNIADIGAVCPDVMICTERIRVLTCDISKPRNLNKDGLMDGCLLSLSEIISLINSGTLTDAVTLAVRQLLGYK